jgi:quercetin dioxygenase-like cupin family protein
MNLSTQPHAKKRKGIMNATALLTFTFAVLLAAIPATPVAADPGIKEHKPVIVQPSELQWSHSPALPAGVKVSVLYGDINKAEPIGFRVKLPAGATIAPHTHPADERVTVISGAFAMGEGEKFEKAALKDMPVGSVAIFPRGCRMFGFAREETIIQVNAEGPWTINYVKPADDPRNK